MLVPADVEKRVPRKRKVLKFKKKLKVQLNKKATWSTYQVCVSEEEGEEVIQTEVVEELSTFEDMEQAFGVPTGEVTSLIPKSATGKKDPYRLTINYKGINKIMVDTGYLIPNINFLFTLLAKAKYFSVF